MNRKDLFTKFLTELDLKFVVADEPGSDHDPSHDFILFDIILPGGYICLDIYENEIEVHGHGAADPHCYPLCDPTSLDKVKALLKEEGGLTPYPVRSKIVEESGHKSRE